MQTIALIGFLGGLITGISPCILPVLPVILLSGMDGDRRGVGSAARPYLVIAGLVCSFSVATLIGSALLTALHLPQDAIRWTALVVLTAIGLGLIFPPLQQLIERPFAYLPQPQRQPQAETVCSGPTLALRLVGERSLDQLLPRRDHQAQPDGGPHHQGGPPGPRRAAVHSPHEPLPAQARQRRTAPRRP
ncbi:cytochrome c biogenesis CcdA family protein, partial [Mycobacterium avium]|uniref:cytochrome c biogenesis CcdA family protein n=1 Tax=Mycobacterium avium TaxID=1764 RepID=UPI003AFAEB30